MLYEPMGRRTAIVFAAIGVVAAVTGLLLRPVTVAAAVIAFLVALGSFGLAGYGLLERAIATRQRRRLRQ